MWKRNKGLLFDGVVMELIFLGTGGAWGIPEIKCECLICRELRKKGEKRDRTSLLLKGESHLLVDCGPDAKEQLSRNLVDKVDGVLITHEHGDHFIGLDELFAYKRNSPRDDYRQIPVYLTEESWKTIQPRFEYLEDLQVLNFKQIEPKKQFTVGEFSIVAFSTEHGAFAKGSVGYLIKFRGSGGQNKSLLYTSDFVGLTEIPGDIQRPDYLVIQSFWLNEPVNNRPSHMSFQRALKFIEMFDPVEETFLVHIGDADMVPGDPCNTYAKKYEPLDPLTNPSDGKPYTIPLNQDQWQSTVDLILSDLGIKRKVTVAYDDLRVRV
jgi:phosphoribosyl 1,2-cyclic phosphate phosphodiesterase